MKKKLIEGKKKISLKCMHCMAGEKKYRKICEQCTENCEIIENLLVYRKKM